MKKATTTPTNMEQQTAESRFGNPQRFDRDKLQIGYNADNGEKYDFWETPVMWDFKKYAHMLICGATGSGKTVAVKELLSGAAGWIPRGVKLWLCDFKNDDFRFCEGAPRYYGFSRCADGLRDFYAAFEARQNGTDESRSFLLLVFDEWGAYLSTLDKKQADAEKAKLSALLMLGRSFNVHVIISQQRADAEYFSKARDNFGAILGMGNLSKEAKEMLFSEVKDEMRPIDERGIGYFLQGGQLLRLWVAHLPDDKDLNAAIFKLVA